MRTRRALSSVVGMVFAIIALSSTFVYISYSMNTLSNYNQSVVQKNQQLADVGKEKFQITSVTFANNKFNIAVANTGNLPINFTKLWIQNMTNTDWYKGYVPTSNIVGPGQTVTNIGQSFKDISSMSIVSTKPYNLKLVTSRGNAQQFSVGSASTAPLNIQLLTLPPSVSSGFNSQLTMIVINNGSSTLTNISPTALPISAPGLTGAATCTAGSVSPSSYNTVAPGSMAVFTWSVKATGINDGDSCTYTLTTPLQNGYAQTVTATITVNKITFSSTNLAANTGVLTINYTSWRYTTGSGWQVSYSLASNAKSGFAINLTNNDPTRTFYLSNKTSLAFSAYSIGTQASTSSSSFILSNVTSAAAFTRYTCTGYPVDDYCTSIAPGHSIYLSIGGTKQGSLASVTDLSQVPNRVGPTTAFLLLYGKFDASRTGSGPLYSQNVPFISVWLTP